MPIRFFLPHLAVFLLLAIPSAANADPVTAPSPAASVSPQEVVQQFLDARAAGHLDQAYPLLSSDTRRFLTMHAFLLGKGPSFTFGGSDSPQADTRIAAVSQALTEMFAPPQDQSDYQFTVVGSGASSPRNVVVSAMPTHGQAAVLFTVATVLDPQSGNVPRIDSFATAAYDQDFPDTLEYAHQKGLRIISENHMKQIMLGILQYSQDNDEHYPRAAHWVDQIMPYIKKAAVFHDPSSPPGQLWSYAFNRNLSRNPLAKFDAPASTVAVFETTKTAKNSSDTGQSVPRPGRHLGGSDFGFADGHVKWFPDGTRLSYQLSGK